jgi:hypothetical protein
VLSSLRSNEKQIHDVCTRDEQHARDGAQNNPEYATDVADDDITERSNDRLHLDLFDGLNR